MDDHVVAAIAAGVRQIVVCGAGLDDRALRFRTPGVRFFEVDHPVTQADKAARLRAIGVAAGGDGADAAGAGGDGARGDGAGGDGAGGDGARDDGAGGDGAGGAGVGGADAGLGGPGPVLVSCDFQADQIAAALEAYGHRDTEATTFLCEGLLVYLDLDACRRLLTGLAARAPAGSTLAASLATHASELSAADVAAEANARRRHGGAEPWRTILRPEEHLALLEDAGWRVTAVTESPPASADVSHGRKSILVTAAPAGRR